MFRSFYATEDENEFIERILFVVVGEISIESRQDFRDLGQVLWVFRISQGNGRTFDGIYGASGEAFF